MNSELEDKCASIYEDPDLRFYTSMCRSVMLDSEFTKDNAVEKRSFTCNIPGVNTSSNIVMYYNKVNNTICPTGGWCSNPNNNIDITKFDVTDLNSPKIILQGKIKNEDNVDINLCENILGGTSETNTYETNTSLGDTSQGGTSETNTSLGDTSQGDTSQTYTPSPCEDPLLNLNYNNNCTLIEQDNKMLQSFCGTINGEIDWKLDDKGELYCHNNELGYSIYKSVDNIIKCDEGVNVGENPAFKIHFPLENTSIFCPAGYCSKYADDTQTNTADRLNIDNITNLIANTEKHPFCKS